MTLMTDEPMGTAAGPADRFAGGVIVAAGRGTRYGAEHKILLPLAGRPALAWVLAAFARAETIASLVIVAGPHTRLEIDALARACSLPVTVVTGGDRRQDSVAAGVRSGGEWPVVVIHDGARPLVTPSLIDDTARRAAHIGAAIAAAPMTDTLKRVDVGGIIRETVPRDAFWAAQTPQAFRRERLLDLIASPDFATTTFTDEAALFEAAGDQVAVVPSLGANPKVTHPGDLAVIEALLAARLNTSRDGLAE